MLSSKRCGHIPDHWPNHLAYHVEQDGSLTVNSMHTNLIQTQAHFHQRVEAVSCTSSSGLLPPSLAP